MQRHVTIVATDVTTTMTAERKDDTVTRTKIVTREQQRWRMQHRVQ